jgi:Vam6/Vps39-like protein vacuolar protein sorting-associated protein 39
MATLEARWDLKCSPRCVAVNVAPTVSIPRSATTTVSTPSSTTNNVKANSSESTNKHGISSLTSSTNPFDEAQGGGSITSSWSKSKAGVSIPAASSLPPQFVHGYTVLAGSDRGSIHLRTFSDPSSNNPSSLSSPSSTRIIKPPLLPLGYELSTMNSSSTAISSINNTAGNTSLVHPMHKPLDSNANLFPNAPVMACIRAGPQNITMSDGTNGIYTHTNVSSYTSKERTTTTTTTTTNPTNPTLLYLCLQQQPDESASNHHHHHHHPTTTSTNTTSSSLAEQSITFASTLLQIHTLTNSTSKLIQELPNMTCATYHTKTGYIYVIHKSILSLPSKAVKAISKQMMTSSIPYKTPTTYFNAIDILPGPVRSGNQSMNVVCHGHVVVVAVGNSFYAVSGSRVPLGLYNDDSRSPTDVSTNGTTSTGSTHGNHSTTLTFTHDDNDDNDDDETLGRTGHDIQKVISFRQGSQVHPAIVVDIPTQDIDISVSSKSKMKTTIEKDVGMSLLFLASGRECAAVEILYNPKLYSNASYQKSTVSQEDVQDQMHLPLSTSTSGGSIVVGKPRHDITSLTSPILAAVGIKATSARSGPMVAILTSDGLVHTRSPSCISIPLFTMEVGTRPNDFFSLLPLPENRILATSYGGEGCVLSLREDTLSDLADRVMTLSIDAFGSSGFPRTELAEAIGASFSATSYVGPEPTNAAKTTLKQYLELILGLDGTGIPGDGDHSCWFFANDVENESSTASIGLKSSRDLQNISAFVSATAILCLDCIYLSPRNVSLANRAAKTCATRIGIMNNPLQNGINTYVLQLCTKISEILLSEAERAETSGPNKIRKGINMDLVETASWMMRACGQHKQSMDIIQVRMNDPSIRNRTFVSELPKEESTILRRGWSQLKYESFIAIYLQELWRSKNEDCMDLVLKLDATRRLLESNSSLGLSVFTSEHPRTEEQWTTAIHPMESLSVNAHLKVVHLLKDIKPQTTHSSSSDSTSNADNTKLPLETGRALAATYLESVIGIDTMRPPVTKSRDEVLNSEKTIHDELALLLLEGVLAERSDNDEDPDSPLGCIYRFKLRRLLGWYNAHVSPDELMSALPTSFLRERALLLGQLGRHEDAIKIFYCDLKSLDLALEYCDATYEKQQAAHICAKRITTYDFFGDHHVPTEQRKKSSCPYLPLVRVVLEHNEENKQSGIDAAIKVISSRRNKIDRAAAIRLLPRDMPVSSMSKSFLIPALIDSDSEIRRLTVVSSLLRTKYMNLKQSLTDAQIKSQFHIQNIPALKSLDLGEVTFTSKPFQIRSTNLASSSPIQHITLIKHFFPRFVVIQAIISNPVPDNVSRKKFLGEVQFVVAESSEEALIPSISVPIKVLPPNITGSSWCALAASPHRLDGTAILTCEVRFNVLDVDSATGAPLHFGPAMSTFNSSFQSHVEEMEDIKIRRSEFE